MAAQDLGVPLPTAVRGRTTEFACRNVSKLNPLIFSDYQKLAQHYNMLVGEFESIEEAIITSSTDEEMNSRIGTAANLRNAASNRLLEEIDRLDLQMYRARVERRRSASSDSKLTE